MILQLNYSMFPVMAHSKSSAVHDLQVLQSCEFFFQAFERLGRLLPSSVLAFLFLVAFFATRSFSALHIPLQNSSKWFSCCTSLLSIAS